MKLSRFRCGLSTCRRRMRTRAHLLCPKHWRLLPRELRKEIQAACWEMRLNQEFGDDTTFSRAKVADLASVAFRFLAAHSPAISPSSKPC